MKNIQFIFGFHLSDKHAQAVAKKLTEILHKKEITFQFTRDNHCTIFTTPPTNCGAERFLKMQNFLDGIRFAVVMFD